VTHHHSIVCELVAVSVEGPLEVVAAERGSMTAAIETAVVGKHPAIPDRACLDTGQSAGSAKMTDCAGPAKAAEVEYWDDESRVAVDGLASLDTNTLADYCSPLYRSRRCFWTQ